MLILTVCLCFKKTCLVKISAHTRIAFIGILEVLMGIVWTFSELGVLSDALALFSGFRYNLSLICSIIECSSMCVTRTVTGRARQGRP